MAVVGPDSVRDAASGGAADPPRPPQRGISGRYEGGKSSVGVHTDIMELRIDVDVRHSPHSPVTHRVSGDFFTQRVAGNARDVHRFYLASWIVDDPVVTWERDRAVVTGNVRYWRGNHAPTSVVITVAWTQGEIQPATVEFGIAGAAPSIYQCAYRSDSFRSLTLEVDVAASVDAVPRLPAYDTHAHDLRPPDLVSRSLTLISAYREAGVAITMSPNSTVIDDSAPGFATWSAAELHDAMEQSFSGIGQRWPAWSMWGLLAGTYDDAGVGGVMFDAASAVGGAGRAPERQGFAVFRRHPWFDQLIDGTPADQNQAAAQRKFLYTWVHEAGHAFNFLHSWNKARPNALSWMNYDWKYDRNNGEGEFWSNFRFRFDDEELVHLRHGDRAAVAMGGDPWSSGGHLEAPSGTSAEAEPGQPLELLLRAKPFFDCMEPVEIEFRLRNTTSMPLEVDARLDPKYGLSTVYVLRPDGKAVQYNSVVCLYGSEKPLTLTAAAAGLFAEGPDRYSELVPLTYGSRGFVFDVPGRYEVRAIYGSRTQFALSNTLSIRVGQPVTKDEDQFAADFFDDSVGLTLSLGGSMSPHLSHGLHTLSEAADRFAGEDRGTKAAVVVANSLGNDFYRRVSSTAGEKMELSHRADPAAGLAISQTALESCRTATEPSNNLVYRNLVNMRAAWHAGRQEPGRARSELLDLAKILERRTANVDVVQAVRDSAATAAGDVEPRARPAAKRAAKKKPS